MKKIIFVLLLILTTMSIAKQVVYVTPNGKKYHSTKFCRTLAKSKKILEIDISQVKNRKACKVCF